MHGLPFENFYIGTKKYAYSFRISFSGFVFLLLSPAAKAQEINTHTSADNDLIAGRDIFTSCSCYYFETVKNLHRATNSRGFIFPYSSVLKKGEIAA